MYPNVHCTIYYESESHSVMSDSLRSHGLYSPWNSPGQNTGVGSLSLLQGILPTQGLNPDLLHCRWILYQLSHKGIPRILEWVAYPFSSGSYWPIELGSPALQVNSLPTELPGKPTVYYGSNPNMPRQMISFRRCLCLSLSHTHTLEYYSAIKDQILPFVAMWMDLKNIMLSEISWRKTNTVWYHFHVDSKYNTNEYICKNVDSQI